MKRRSSESHQRKKIGYTTLCRHWGEVACEMENNLILKQEKEMDRSKYEEQYVNLIIFLLFCEGIHVLGIVFIR